MFHHCFIHVVNESESGEFVSANVRFRKIGCE